MIGSRATLKGLLLGLLEPIDTLAEYESTGKYFERLALLDEIKSLPSGAVWDYYCAKKGVPVGTDWISDVQSYENTVTIKRG